MPPGMASRQRIKSLIIRMLHWSTKARKVWHLPDTYSADHFQLERNAAHAEVDLMRCMEGARKAIWPIRRSWCSWVIRDGSQPAVRGQPIWLRCEDPQTARDGPCPSQLVGNHLARGFPFPDELLTRYGARATCGGTPLDSRGLRSPRVPASRATPM